jgi:fatty-acyl-CoA synthase
VDNQSRNIVHAQYYPLRKIQGQLGLATLLKYRKYQDNIAMTKLTKSYMTGEGSGQLLYETIGNCFDRIVEQYPDSPALIVPFQDIRWTYRELQVQVDRFAAGLLALGIEAGDRVGVWGPNSYEWVVTQFATAKIGAIMVCINPAYRLFELEFVMNKVECKAIVSAEKFKSSEYLAMLNKLAPELSSCEPGYLRADKLPYLTTVIRMGEGQSSGMFNFKEVCEFGADNAHKRFADLRTELGPDDAINIQFTSGTTGNPKGATLTHCNILNNGYNAGLGMRLTSEDKLCMPVPLYHCFGMVLGVLACVTTGAAIVLPSPVYDPVSTLKAVEDEQCTALHGVPTMFVTELDHPEFASFDTSSLHTGIIAGAPCPEELMKRIIADMHMDKVLIGYGQTELSPVNHMTLPDDSLENRTQTVGRPIPYVEVKIVDQNDRVVPIGEQGEICTRGYSVMKGYWNDEEKTAETIIDGWLHSGDLGTMNEHGYVRITGRIKDMIIRGGENIYPREIEEFLYTHPKVSEVQVFGVEDPRMGEEVCAWVQIRDGESATEDEIRDFCKGQIAHFKIPRYVRFVSEYPMTVTGKIRKVEMREMMARELYGQRRNVAF